MTKRFLLLFIVILLNFCRCWKQFPSFKKEDVEDVRHLIKCSLPIIQGKSAKTTIDNCPKGSLGEDKASKPNNKKSKNGLDPNEQFFSLSFPEKCLKKPTGDTVEESKSLHHLVPQELIKGYLNNALSELTVASLEGINEFFNFVNEQLNKYCSAQMTPDKVNSNMDFLHSLFLFYDIFLWGTGNIVPGPSPESRLNDLKNSLDLEIVDTCSKQSIQKIKSIYKFLSDRKIEYTQLVKLRENISHYSIPQGIELTSTLSQYKTKKNEPVNELIIEKDTNILINFKHNEIQEDLNKLLLHDLEKFYSTVAIRRVMDALFHSLDCKVKWDALTKYCIKNLAKIGPRRIKRRKL